jgi:hypothetical protein
MLSCSLAFAVGAAAFPVFPKSASTGIVKTSVLRIENPKRYIVHLNTQLERLLLWLANPAPTPPMALGSANVGGYLGQFG